jgi:hypothetical protein
MAVAPAEGGPPSATAEAGTPDRVLVSYTSCAPQLSPPSIFDSSLYLDCPTPKTTTRLDPGTGELIDEVLFRYSVYHRGLIPVRCNRNGCPACGVFKARGIALAIWQSQPQYQLTLTGLTLDRPANNKRVDKFVAAMRSTYPTFEWTCQFEPNASGRGSHAHLFIHVAEISRSVVKKAWKRRVGLKRLRPRSTPGFFGYQMKSLLIPDDRAAFLALNGVPSKQYLIRSSKKFYRNGRGGQPISRASAEAIARRRRAWSG